MIYRCKTCNSALEYDVELDRMKCAACGNLYGIAELNISSDSVMETSEPELRDSDNEENIYCKIYSCTACGADMIVNHMEAATFCTHCGQPTVMFSRVTGELGPKYLVPFQMNKKEALEIVAEEIEKSKWTPTEIKKQIADSIRGIYIPYNICDVEVYDNQVWRHQRLNKTSATYVHKREVRQTYYNLPIVACSWLEESITRRLEPYNLLYRKHFAPEYLAGYYADRYDMGEGEVRRTTIKRISPVFHAEAKDSLHDKLVKLKRTNPRYNFKKMDYVLLPAWFVTVSYQGEPYTFIVNGQTGKFVGSLPIQWKKVVSFFLKTAFPIFALIIGLPAIMAAFLPDKEMVYLTWEMLMGVIGFLVSFLYIGSWADIRWMQKVRANTKSRIMRKYARERQDKEDI